MVKVDVHILCWNESRIIPFVMDYYTRYVQHIYVYDNQSTDHSQDLLNQYPNVTITEYESCDQIRDDIYLNLKNNIWKQSRGNADFVIVCDMDEIVWMDGILNHLKECQEKGISVIRPRLFQVLSKEFPQYNKGLVHTQCVGFRQMHLVKSLIFNPNMIQEINYDYGAHECRPQGKGQHISSPCLNTLHLKFIGREYMIERKNQYAERMSQRNIEKKLGMKYLDPDCYYYEWFDKKIKYCRPIDDLINKYDNPISEEETQDEIYNTIHSFIE